MRKRCRGKHGQKHTPQTMRQVPRHEWPAAQGDGDKRIELWIDGNFLAQVFDEGAGVLRVSVNRVFAGRSGDFADGIRWEDLMSIKRKIGRGDTFAVEVLPRDEDIVNVANMRHFWILPDIICGWTRPGRDNEEASNERN